MKSKILATSVAETGFTAMLERLGRDCSPIQYLREFIKNGEEAILRTPKKTGDIHVDVNWDIYNPEESNVYKISFTDTGDGMTGKQLVDNINHLSISGHKNQHENFGMGAKISAFTRNREGVIYESWTDTKKDGCGILVGYDPEEGIYGILPNEENPDETYWTWKPKTIPKIIQEAGSGTRVTLCGQYPESDTMNKPDRFLRGSQDSWLVYQINSRFFEFPKDINVKVRLGYYRGIPKNGEHEELENEELENNENKDGIKLNTKRAWLCTIKGQKKILDEWSLNKGELKISDAKIHWWLLDPDRNKPRDRERREGHCGLLNQGEVIKVTENTYNRCIHFGVILGHQNVAIYVEPDPNKYEQDTTRSDLRQINGADLPWDRWYKEFRENMPEPIKKYVDDLMGKTSDTDTDSILKKLKKIENFFKLSRYVSNKKGAKEVDPGSISEGGTQFDDYGNTPGAKGKNGSSRSGSKSGISKTKIFNVLAAGGIKGEENSSNPFPKVKWQAVSEGTRSEDDNRDRAARYVPMDHIVMANFDFQGFQDVVDHFNAVFSENEGHEVVVAKHVRQVYERTLMETVAGALALKKRPNWNNDDIENAYSPEALTVACMNRSFQIDEIKRQIGYVLKHKVDESEKD